MRVDMHTHSRHSPDSRLDPRDMVRRIRQLGLDGLAITDHNEVLGGKEALDYAQTFPGLVVIRAVEVSSAQGHVLGYGVTERIPRDLSPVETVEHIIAQGGVAVAAHPYRFWSGLGEDATVGTNFTVYEVQNARTSKRGNYRAAVLAANGGKGTIGGSDGHFIEEIGGAVTVFEETLDKEDDILHALQGRATRAEGHHRSLKATLRYVPKCVGEWMTRGFKRI